MSFATISMSQAPYIIKNLEAARRLSFTNFENIVLQPGAVKVLVNLFLHPGCKSDVNLATFLTGLPVNLVDISPHIITAFPSQIASYAERQGLNKIYEADLLECFALDHADAVERNHLALMMDAAYALAHVLTIGKVSHVRKSEQRQLVDLQVKVCNEVVDFSHVLVPADVPVKSGQTVFHHFGVVVAFAHNPDLKTLAWKLQQDQNKKTFMKRITKQVLGEHIKAIDYAKESFFRVDMAGQIIKESKKDVDFFRLWQEEDLKKIKIPKSEKVMFQS